MNHRSQQVGTQVLTNKTNNKKIRRLRRRKSEITDFRPQICTPANKCLQYKLEKSRANIMAERLRT